MYANENIFFDLKKIRKMGKNVIIGKTVRIRYPELVEIGDNVIIDDFVYISTKTTIGNNVHIASGCKLIGGRMAQVELSDFSTLAPNVVLAAGSDDYNAGIASPLVPQQFKGNAVIGCIYLARHSIVGANSTVLPNVIFGDGASVGAQSLVKYSLAEWSLYAGIPVKKIGQRNKDEIMRLELAYKEKK